MLAGVKSFTGQMAAYLHEYYDDCPVTIGQIIKDTRALGQHAPAELMELCASVPESQMRYLGYWQREATELWNLHFDQRGVDLIL